MRLADQGLALDRHGHVQVLVVLEQDLGDRGRRRPVQEHGAQTHHPLAQQEAEQGDRQSQRQLARHEGLRARAHGRGEVERGERRLGKAPIVTADPSAAGNAVEGSRMARGNGRTGRGAYSSEVQCPQRVALMGIVIRHLSQALVVGSAGGGAFFRRLICLMIMKIQKATIRKSTSTWMKLP